MVEADQRHRDHALVEQVIAELKDGPLAHLPSGKYAANAAWVACRVITFNIARAAAVAALMRTARWATLRTRLINIPARIATTARRLVLHLPTHWPWSPGWESLWATATDPLTRDHDLTTQPATARPEDLEVEEPAPTGRSAKPLPAPHHHPFDITHHRSTAVDPGSVDGGWPAMSHERGLGPSGSPHPRSVFRCCDDLGVLVRAIGRETRSRPWRRA